MPLVPVDLEGTWVRAKTAPEDVGLARRKSYLLRTIAERDGWAPRVGIESFTLLAKHPAVKGQQEQERTGTFRARVWVSEPQASFFEGNRMMRSRAKTLLTWGMQDMFCRSPKVTFARAAVRRSEARWVS